MESNRIKETLSLIDQCLEHINPHESTAEEIGRLALSGLLESVEQGFITEEYAHELHARWFGQPRTD